MTFKPGVKLNPNRVKDTRPRKPRSFGGSFASARLRRLPSKARLLRRGRPR